MIPHTVGDEGKGLTRFIPGWIKQLTTEPPPSTPPDLFDVVNHPIQTADAFDGFVLRGAQLRAEYLKQMNLRIQSAAADITAKLIAADIVYSQRCEQVDEIIRDVLFAVFASPEKS